MNSRKITILGGSGYIGSALATTFIALGYSVWTPKRDDSAIFSRELGLVYYCIGLTSDFRVKKYETINAHVGVLKKVLEKSNFNKIIYLSSTRVYEKSRLTDEDQPLLVNPNTPDDLYNISKILGESLVLASGKKNVIVRLSNVVGPDMGGANFIGSLLEEALRTRKLCFYTSKKSAKDYIWIDDVIKSLVKCENTLSNNIYNIASGFNVSNSELADIFSCLGVEVIFSPDVPTILFPIINNKRFLSDAGYAQNYPLNKIKEWIFNEFQKNNMEKLNEQ